MSNERADESLGAWMRQRRKALDLTQAALAACVGCARVTIRKWEAGVTRPARPTAERLATCLHIPPEPRARFVAVARGERRAERVPPILAPHSAPPPARAEVPLAPLPLDTVPPPAPLPPTSRMPLRHNPLFVGREEELRDLARVLKTGDTAAIGQIAAATGLGGIGKTQLAAEFVHRYGQFFSGGVCWLSFADPAAVPAEVAACGGLDGMHLGADFGTLPFDEQIQKVQAAWRKPVSRLLVFDNCEDEALLHQWRPPHGGCRVLLTSRRQQWDPVLGVQSVPLDVLPRRESIALLRQFRPDLPADDADLQAIAEALGNLPLALHLAGSFLAKYRHALTPTQYLERLQAPTILDDPSLHATGLSPTAHVQHVARTFEQSYARLDPGDPTDALALTLLTHAACCAPGEPIPRPFLLQTLPLLEDDAAHVLLAEDALLRLADLGLLDTDAAGNLRLHRLLVAFVRTVSDDPAAQTAVEATILHVAGALNDQRNPRLFLAVQPHLRFLTEAAKLRADARTAALCDALGVHLWQLGVYDEAQGYLEHAVAIRQRVLGGDHPDTARSLSNLANVFYGHGQYAEAQHAHAQALAIRQRVLGGDHLDTARSLNNLGTILEAQGKYAEAQHYIEQAVAIQERVLGREHPVTAVALNNLANVLRSQGQYTLAQHYLEQALTVRKRVLGMDHPSTASSLSNLGMVLEAQGQYALAQDYLEQALAIRQRVSGADHPVTALTLNNLGLVLTAQGKYAAAQHAAEQALAIRQRVLGADHPVTAESLHDLGVLFMAQERYAAAQAYLEQALAIRRRVLGEDHPDIAASLHQLGLVLHTRGQDAAARRALEQALTIYEQAFGPSHPGPQDVRASLAAILNHQ
ncbi:MAG TPA: FxSxx-COOH system tetratricopeptide repeat protein [Herpetosiphonaceae bacterium]